MNATSQMNAFIASLKIAIVIDGVKQLFLVSQKEFKKHY